MIFKARDHVFEIGGRTLLVGVLNVTPDSFSDGGCFVKRQQILGRLKEFQRAEVDIIDIGGESTRPGADSVPEEEELRRVLPAVEWAFAEDGAPTSIDTTKAKVAEACLKKGASIVNDVSGLRMDPDLARVVAEYGAGIILMHRRGTPKTMQSLTHYEDLIGEILEELEGSIDIALKSGISYEQIAIDPGIGFAKTKEQNLFILNHLHRFQSLARPILVGPSRKSFVGEITGKPVSERAFGTAATVALAIVKGAHIVRVHDAEAMRDVIRVTEAILKANGAR